MKKILIVDDSEANGFVIELIVGKFDCTTQFVNDSTRVMEILKEQSFDSILLDISMPKLSGDELCKMIKATYSPERYGVIFAYTAHALGDTTELVEVYGFDDILIKPVTIEKITTLFKAHRLM